jgi:hypothetical protein
MIVLVARKPPPGAGPRPSAGTPGTESSIRSCASLLSFFAEDTIDSLTAREFS